MPAATVLLPWVLWSSGTSSVAEAGCGMPLRRHCQLVRGRRLVCERLRADGSWTRLCACSVERRRSGTQEGRLPSAPRQSRRQTSHLSLPRRAAARVVAPKTARPGPVFESRSQNNSYTPAPFFSARSARRFSRKKGVNNFSARLARRFLGVLQCFLQEKGSNFSGALRAPGIFFFAAGNNKMCKLHFSG